MPFRSRAQQRYLFARHPAIAREFAAATKDYAALPARVGDSTPETRPQRKDAQMPMSILPDPNAVDPTDALADGPRGGQVQPGTTPGDQLGMPAPGMPGPAMPADPSLGAAPPAPVPAPAPADPAAMGPAGGAPPQPPPSPAMGGAMPPPPPPPSLAQFLPGQVAREVADPNSQLGAQYAAQSAPLPMKAAFHTSVTMTEHHTQAPAARVAHALRAKLGSAPPPHGSTGGGSVDVPLPSHQFQDIRDWFSRRQSPSRPRIMPGSWKKESTTMGHLPAGAVAGAEAQLRQSAGAGAQPAGAPAPGPTNTQRPMFNGFSAIAGKNPMPGAFGRMPTTMQGSTPNIKMATLRDVVRAISRLGWVGQGAVLGGVGGGVLGAAALPHATPYLGASAENYILPAGVGLGAVGGAIVGDKGWDSVFGERQPEKGKEDGAHGNMALKQSATLEQLKMKLAEMQDKSKPVSVTRGVTRTTGGKFAWKGRSGSTVKSDPLYSRYRRQETSS